MKLKKFFAGVLAAAMMLTVGATAAFATEGNKVDASYEGTAGEYNAKMFVPVDGKAEIDLTKVLTVVGIGLTVISEVVGGIQQKQEIRETVNEVLSEREKES